MRASQHYSSYSHSNPIPRAHSLLLLRLQLPLQVAHKQLAWIMRRASLIAALLNKQSIITRALATSMCQTQVVVSACWSVTTWGVIGLLVCSTRSQAASNPHSMV